jgi:hypothetical protein
MQASGQRKPCAHLAKPSSESSAIAEAATKLLSELPTHALQSFNLTLSTVAAPGQDAPAINP